MDGILNFTELSKKEALELLDEKKELVLKGESDRDKRIDRYVANIDIWLNNIWSSEDLAFFESLDITPYEFPVHRPLVNNMISRQRNRPISFDIVPHDIHSYRRHRKGKEEFIQKELSREDSTFTTADEAGEFYDKYADDEYAKAASIVLDTIRKESKAQRIDSTVFQQGIITGLDFWKAIYSNKYNRNGSIEIARRPQNAIFYDETSVEQDLSDVEFIGEVHKLYKQQLVNQYPAHKEEIEEYFKHYTNKKRGNLTREHQDWKYFYQFDSAHDTKPQVRVAEIWTLETEERFKVVDNETGEERVIKFGIEEDQIFDDLMTMMILQIETEAKDDPEAAELLQGENVKQVISQMVQDQYTIESINEPVWYKTVFTYNALLEHTRSTLPHNGHPYYPFFAQFSEGEFRGLLDDIKDVIISINKALAFRELMMSHGAKNVLVLDQKTITESGYSVDDIAEEWTSVGSIIALKLKTGKKINDVFQNINTVGDAMPAINALLADLDNRLYQISGVNLAQLGVVERETTNAGYRAQVQQGQTNNGLIFDNYYTSLEYFYNEKVVPLVVDFMQRRNNQVIRRIGDEYSEWVEIELEEDFDLFEDAVRNGQYATVLRAKPDNEQMQEEWSAKLMEMSLAGMIDPEIAIEYSPNPDRYKILKKMKEKEIERARRQAYQQFSFEEFLNVAMESGLPAEAIEEMIDKLKKTKLMEEIVPDEVAGAQIQRQQGGMGRQAAPNIRGTAGENQRLNTIANQEG